MGGIESVGNEDLHVLHGQVSGEETTRFGMMRVLDGLYGVEEVVVHSIEVVDEDEEGGSANEAS